MGYPFGKDSVEITPGVFQGTEPEGVQRALGSLFASDGIIPGRDIVTVVGTTSWQYEVTVPGAVYYRTSTGVNGENMGFIIPVERTTVSVAPLPAGEGRLDYVYVDEDGVVRVASNVNPNTLPGVVLNGFMLHPGDANTRAGNPAYDRKFAILSGASLGLLHKYHDPGNYSVVDADNEVKGAGRFVLPTDRMVRFDLTHSVWAGSSNIGKQGGILRWVVYLDGEPIQSFQTKGGDGWTNTSTFSFTETLYAGAHTVHYVQDTFSDTEVMLRKGGANADPGCRFEIWDGGVSA